MARLSLNKSALTRLNRRLKGYRAFLPSLDMKKKQLLLEQARERVQLREQQQLLEQIERRVREELPMLGSERLRLDGLLLVTEVDTVQENIVGVRVPQLRAVRFDARPYSMLALPHWVDNLLSLLRQAVELKLRMAVYRQRLTLLETAVRKVTQRLNLFEKVLIPRTRAQIKKIQIFIADEERSGVVRAKLAKGKKRPLA
jgi:V/A-type H+-transporting ATPase subunit D